jgi:predicted DNA-binding transcriptional regulator AlpA
MSDPSHTLEVALEGLLRRIVREEIGTLKTDVNGQDRLLDAEEAAKLLSVSEDWLYRNAKKLPFSRKLGPKMLRFSSDGIQKFLATRKIA